MSRLSAPSQRLGGEPSPPPSPSWEGHPDGGPRWKVRETNCGSAAAAAASKLGRGATRRRGRKCGHLLLRSLSLAGLLLMVAFASLISLGPLLLRRRRRWLHPDKSSGWCPSGTNVTARKKTIALLSNVTETASSSWFKLLEEKRRSKYPNPDYDDDPCYHSRRVPRLLWMTIEDCDVCLRLLVSTLLGGIIGFERQLADRPAGIRTMGLVTLGSCFFTVCSVSAFKSSPMRWDASRVTADLPKAVGFLGAALIWKGNVGGQDQVRGLTTAASVWLSAAVGVGCGSGTMYATSIFGTFVVLLLLRFGPRLYNPYASDDGHDDDDEEEEEGDTEEDECDEGDVDAATNHASTATGKPAAEEEAELLRNQLDILDKRLLSTPTLVGLPVDGEAAGGDDNEPPTPTPVDADEPATLRRVRSEAGMLYRRRRSSKKNVPTYGS